MTSLATRLKRLRKHYDHHDGISGKHSPYWKTHARVSGAVVERKGSEPFFDSVLCDADKEAAVRELLRRTK